MEDCTILVLVPSLVEWLCGCVVAFIMVRRDFPLVLALPSSLFTSFLVSPL